MSEPRDLLLVGGAADGRKLTVLYGDSAVVEAPGGERALYRVVRLVGSKRVFHFGVPMDRALDGDWLIEQLRDAYLGGGQ